MALIGVKAFVFDVFGTVVDWRSGVARDAALFLERRAINGIDPLEFADAWRRRYGPAMEEVRSGRRAFVRLDVLHRENLLAVLADYGIDLTSVPAEDVDELNLAWHRLDPWPDSLSGLTRLKATRIIAPLSNGNIVLMLDMAKRAGIPWDAILGAEVVQAYKPMPEAYLRTADVIRSSAGANVPGRRAQQRSRGSEGMRIQDGVCCAPDGTWAGADHGFEGRSGLGRGRA